VTQVQELPVQPTLVDRVLSPLAKPQILGLAGVIVLILVLKVVLDGPASKLSDGRFTRGRELRKGRRKGLMQIAKGRHNEAALLIGSDRQLVLTDVQRSVAVAGSSGSGKTLSLIAPAIHSAIQQGWTSLVYDVKGTLTRMFAPLAAAMGYQVYIFAPGFSYSDRLNLLDFMRSPQDGGMAQEIAKVLNLNFGDPLDRKDPFFGPQGDSLLKSIFMMAKDALYADLLSAWEILGLPNLAQRFTAARQCRHVDAWARRAATGLISVAHAEETTGGIVGSAVTHFQSLIDADLLPCLLKSTIPLDLPGKQIVFFQIDEQREAATAPLVATALHLLVKRNLNATVERKRPFGIFLDEFTSLRLPDIEGWINRFREYGMVCVLGYQADSQLKLRYSRELAEAIISSCATKIIFNPGNIETAEKYSKLFGEKEIQYRTRSTNTGVKGGGSSVNQHLQKVPLMSAAAINRMAAGHCIILSPGFEYRPHKYKVRLNRRDIKQRKLAEQVWNEESKKAYISRNAVSLDLERELDDRSVWAESILPTPAEIMALKTVNQLEGEAHVPTSPTAAL
jgi:type IV secretion system protein VirD4